MFHFLWMVDGNPFVRSMERRSIVSRAERRDHLSSLCSLNHQEAVEILHTHTQYTDTKRPVILLMVTIFHTPSHHHSKHPYTCVFTFSRDFHIQLSSTFRALQRTHKQILCTLHTRMQVHLNPINCNDKVYKLVIWVFIKLQIR